MNGRIMWSTVLAVAVLGASIAVAEAKTAKAGAAASTATVTMTDSRIKVSPASPKTGATSFVVVNRTAQRRGFVISTKDPGGTPAFRYTPLISPGKSFRVDFWLYPGRTYYVKDYTATRVNGTERTFVSRNRSMIRMRGQAMVGRGPRVAPNKGSIVLTDDAVNTGTVVAGSTSFTVTNKSSRARGLVISGKDISGTPMVRHTRLLKPGESVRLNAWLYRGQSYKMSDYTAATVTQGKGMSFESTYSQNVDVAAKTATAQ